MSKITFLNKIFLNKEEAGFKSFLIGLFFLASAPAIASLFLLFSIVLGFKKNFQKLIRDKLNYLLLVSAFIMIIKSIFTTFTGKDFLENWDPILNWLGLGNWLPLFLLFLGVQIYVEDTSQITKVSKALILSTIPVIFSCFSQYVLGWYGPYELFNGLIIWYQRPRTELYQPITGLFNNPNYVGAWIAMIWPLLLTYLAEKKKESSKPKFLIVLSLCILFIFSIGLINSRAAWLGVLATLPLLFGKRILIWLLPILGFIFFSILVCTLPIFPENIKTIFCFLIPNNLLTNFNDLNINYESIPRLMIWKESISLIFDKPFLGWGAASFPIIYFSQYGLWKGHPHNLFFELSISYGLLSSILVFSFIGVIVFQSYKLIYIHKINKSNYEKAWLTSVIVFLIVHSFDIVYFDFRISIVFWILLSGLRVLSNKKYEKIY